MRLLRNETGLSIIETMMAAAIMAVVMAATVSYLEFFNRENVRLNESLARFDLERQVTNSLADPRVCAANLTPPNVTGAVQFDPSRVSPSNPFVVQLKQLLSTVNARGGSVASENSLVSPMTPSLKVQKIELKVTGPNSANFSVSFSGGAMGRALPSLSFPVVIRTTPTGSGAKITGCTNGSSCPAGQITVTDANGVSVCQSMNQLVSALCPSGRLIAGGSGAVNCIDPASLVQPAPTPTPLPTPIPTPTSTPLPNYNNWSVSTTPNGPGNGANWSSRIINAKPGALATWVLTGYTDNQGNPKPTSSGSLGPVNADGTLAWGGPVNCQGTATSCTYTWTIYVTGYGSRLMTSRI